MSCGVGCRCGSDPLLLRLWCRPAAVAPIRPLDWDFPCAVSVALKSKKERKEKEKINPPQEKSFLPQIPLEVQWSPDDCWGYQTQKTCPSFHGWKLHMEYLPPRGTQKQDEWLLHLGHWENTHREKGRKDWAQSHHKPQPQHNALQSGWNPNSQLLPKEQMVWTTHLWGPNHKVATQETGLHITWLWKPVGLRSQVPQGCSQWRSGCSWASPPHSYHSRAHCGKNSPTPVAFPGRGGTAYFTNCCCLKDWLLISMHLGANYILQGAQKIQGTLPPSSPSGSHSNNILKSPVLIFPVMRPTMF